MEEEVIKQVKVTLRSLVVSSPAQMDARLLRHDYLKMLGAPVPLDKLGYREFVAFLREQYSDSFRDQDVFPADCVRFLEQIPALSLADCRPGAMLEVMVGEVYSPSHFWLIRLGENYNIAMEEMMDEMTSVSDGYGMFQSKEEIITDSKGQLEMENGKPLNAPHSDGHHHVTHPTSSAHPEAVAASLSEECDEIRVSQLV